MKILWGGTRFFARLLWRGVLRMIRFRPRSRRLLARLFITGLVLFALSGYVRDAANLNGYLLDGLDQVRDFWQRSLEFLDHIPWLAFMLLKGFDVALVWLFLRSVAKFHLGVPSYLDALVLLRVNLQQGIVWTSLMQLRLLLALPVAVTLVIVGRGHWSLLAIGFALFSLWYLGAAINPRSLRHMMQILKRLSMASREDLDVLDDDSTDDEV